MFLDKSKLDIWINKYLDSVDYIYGKGCLSSKKINIWIDLFSEVKSKKLMQLTLILSLLALTIFLVSCNTSQYGNRVGYTPLPKNQIPQEIPVSKSNSARFKNKNQEQLFIKREKLNILERDSGSATGSIWADSLMPKNLVTEFKPTRVGEYITVNIPESLQYTGEPASTPPAAGTAPPKVDPLKSFKFQVVGIEPGGEVILRGVKNYVADTGETRDVVVMAKLPRRNLNNSEVSANQLTEIAVTDNNNGTYSESNTSGWDKSVSKKLSENYSDSKLMSDSMNAEKKEIDTQKKALADQKKALDDEADRLKKDRKRLDAQTARAKNLLNSATVADKTSAPAGNTASAAQPPAAGAPAATAPQAPPAAGGANNP